jgi:chromosome segregation ATPase
VSSTLAKIECHKIQGKATPPVHLNPSQQQTQHLQYSQHFSPESSQNLSELYAVLWNRFNEGKSEIYDLQRDIKILQSANAQLCLRLQIAERETYNLQATLAYSEQQRANLQRNLRNILRLAEVHESKVNTEIIRRQDSFYHTI